MAVSTLTFFNDYTEQETRGVHDWDAHTFKVMLTNTAPAVTNTVKANLTEIASGNGYPAGGMVTTITVAETGGTTTVSGTECVLSATGAVGPFRYAVLYNDTPASPADPLVAYLDYGSSISLGNNETFTITFNSASPGTIFTKAPV